MNTLAREYDRWLKGATVLLVDESLQDAARYQAWLDEAEATVLTAGYSNEGGVPFADTTHFDIAIVGHRLLDERALRLAMAIRQRQPGCSVLVQCSEASPTSMRQLRHVGVSFLSKGASKTDFMFTMAQLLDGGMPDVDMLVARAQRRWRLSRQQTRILYYNLWSCSNEEIAGSLGVSLNTVQEYQQKLRSKTGARAKDGYFRLLMETAGRRAPVRGQLGKRVVPEVTGTGGATLPNQKLRASIVEPTSAALANPARQDRKPDPAPSQDPSR